MSGYTIGWGMPPFNCNICGGRVPGDACERHIREPAFMPLRDKTFGIFLIRIVACTSAIREGNE